MIFRSRASKSLSGRVGYVLKEGDEEEEVLWSILDNFYWAEDPQDAGHEMEMTASFNPWMRDPAYHFVLGYALTDDPSKEEQVYCAREVLKELGLEEHQALIAAHGDTNTPHVHVVVNLVHPDTHVGESVYRDYYIAGHVLGRLEKELGLHEVERRPGKKAFHRLVQEQAREVLAEASSWKELSDGLQKHGLGVELRGKRVMVVELGEPDPLKRRAASTSDVDRRLRKRRLVGRLGAAPEWLEVPVSERENLQDVASGSRRSATASEAAEGSAASAEEQDERPGEDEKELPGPGPRPPAQKEQRKKTDEEAGDKRGEEEPPLEEENEVPYSKLWDKRPSAPPDEEPSWEELLERAGPAARGDALGQFFVIVRACEAGRWSAERGQAQAEKVFAEMHPARREVLRRALRDGYGGPLEFENSSITSYINLVMRWGNPEWDYSALVMGLEMEARRQGQPRNLQRAFHDELTEVAHELAGQSREGRRQVSRVVFDVEENEAHGDAGLPGLKERWQIMRRLRPAREAGRAGQVLRLLEGCEQTLDRMRFRGRNQDRGPGR